MAGESAGQWSWCDLPVDPAGPHFDLRFGSLQEPGSGTLPLLVARVGRPVNRVFPVEWLVKPADEQREALDAVTKDLDYYLVAKGEADPWLYAQHHAGTAANLYSSVHWSFHSDSADSVTKLDSLSRLNDVGFQRCGSWSLVFGKPVPTLEADLSAQGVLYAFVSGREVLYVGKTNLPLRRRMHGYRRPGPTQRTNAAVNAKISQLLASQRPLDIYAFSARVAIRRGTFEVNLAAGLEDAIIRELQPPWNHMGK